MDIAVETRNITKRFEKGRVVALDNVSIYVKKGEIFTLLGPSGSGKSTLLRIIDGLEEPDSGDVFIDGKCVTHVPAHKRDVCMVFQRLALFPHKNVFENVAFGLKMHKIDKNEIKKRVEETLWKVELNPEIYALRFPHQLSGGEMQRVALARALVLRPAVILFDEPLSSLDKRLRDKMRVELKQILKRFNLTAIYVTHDQEEAFVLSDRMAIINKGKILQEGTPRELYEKPQSSFIANFLGDTNIFKGVIKQMKGNLVIIELQDGICITANYTETPPISRDVLVSLKAEKIVLSDRPLFENHLEATVKEAIFVGEKIIYVVELNKELTLKVIEKNFGKTWRKGDRVLVNWLPDDIILIPE
ncbi:ABC transporter ATP-binding protein [Candidatus Bathyarchaeota archaeon]|nr:ABC transporter ATP-binding protein [Candidatus Bathyarchaeota archaeon]